MPVESLRYRFRQRFRAPAGAAFAWCVDFQPSDGRLMRPNSRRAVRWLAPDTAVLTDTTYPEGRRRRIRRLVRIDFDHLAWTNTHLDGPFRHSQFWYRVVADGPRRSHLEFEGLKLETVRRRSSRANVARRAEAERRGDAGTWKRSIAPALDTDLAPRGRRR